MNFRRTTSSTSLGTDIPYIPKYCARLCSCPGMWWRSRTTSIFGGASPCKLTLVEDGVTNYYRRIDCTRTGQWKLPLYLGGSVVRTCAGSSYMSTAGNVPTCSGDSDSHYECDAPAGYEGIPLTYTEESSCSGSSPVTSSTAADAARAAATTNVTPWSDWQQGYPYFSLTDGGCTDTRGPGFASFYDRKIEIEFAGAFRPFMIRRKETVTVSYEDGTPPSTTNEIIDLPVLAAEPLVIEWNAAPNTSRLIAIIAFYPPR